MRHMHISIISMLKALENLITISPFLKNTILEVIIASNVITCQYKNLNQLL